MAIAHANANALDVLEENAQASARYLGGATAKRECLEQTLEILAKNWEEPG